VDETGVCSSWNCTVGVTSVSDDVGGGKKTGWGGGRRKEEVNKCKQVKNEREKQRKNEERNNTE
jgi:hypothetical protein